MRTLKWLFLLLCVGSVAAQAAQTEKKKLLVLSSVGGGGHITACHTLQQLVGEDYHFQVVYPINDLRILGVSQGEQFYNNMLKRGWIRPMNFIVRHVAPPIFHARHSKMEKLIVSYIEDCHPDLVVSLIPFVNYPASEAARKEGLPFLLITTDNDLRHWLLDIQEAKNPQMKITIGTELPYTKQLLLDKKIAPSAIETIGLPLRSEFRGQKDREAICKGFHLSLDQKRLLIMMGGAGGPIATEYTRFVGKLPLGINIVVVAGRNEELKKELEEIEIDPSNTLTVFGYTDRIADLMAVSDLMITKPGPGTINEALAMKLPMLIDNTNISVYWERINVDLVLGYGVGQKVKKLDQLEELLTRYFQTPNIQELRERAFVNVPVNQFHLRIPEIIKEMIAENERAMSLSQ